MAVNPDHRVSAQSAPQSEAAPHAPKIVPDWLDGHRWLLYLILTIVPFLPTLPLWICHLSTDPIWLDSGVVQNVKPGLIPGSSNGDPNVGWTSQALGHLAASQWLHGKVPWWNAYSGIGLPLAGEMQPGAFFLPFVLLLLLRNGFLWLRIAMQLVAGFSTFALLRELSLGRLAALAGGILFELNETFALTRGPDSFFCAAAFLPVLLLGIEQVSKRERQPAGTLWIALGIAFSLLAGFPEAAYIDGLLALLWSIYRFATLQQRWRFALRVAWGGVLGLCLAAPLLAGFYSLTRNSSAFKTHGVGIGSFTHVAFPVIFVPYIYGTNPALGYLIPLEWSKAGGYISILVLFFALLGLQARKPHWLRMLLAAWVIVAWAKSFSLQPLADLMNHIPFLLQTAFYRYSAPSWELCLMILAAFAIEDLRDRNLRLRLAGLLTTAVLLGSIYIAWHGGTSGTGKQHKLPYSVNP